MTILKDKPATREEACEKLTRMVGRLAYQYTKNHTQDREDIFNEGMLGVLHAYDKYEPEHGAAFSSYAYLWVRHFIQQYAGKSWKDKNNTASKDFSDYELAVENQYKLDTISLDLYMSKQDQQVQEIYQLRKDGFTFQEVSDILGAGSLHQVRNKFMKAVEKLTESSYNDPMEKAFLY